MLTFLFMISMVGACNLFAADTAMTESGALFVKEANELYAHSFGDPAKLFKINKKNKKQEIQLVKKVKDGLLKLVENCITQEDAASARHIMELFDIVEGIRLDHVGCKNVHSIDKRPSKIWPLIRALEE